MEIRDVVTIQSLEEYLKERNFKVNAYEEDILQAIWPFLRDRQRSEERRVGKECRL